MKKIYLLLLLFCSDYIYAQSAHSYWSVGINPLGVGESMPSIGPSVAYRVSPKIELWAEASYILTNWYAYDSWKNLHGYRFIFQPRFYPGPKRKFFIAAEFRLKILLPDY